MYLTYTDYLILGGSLDENEFLRAEWKAAKLVDKYTFGRLKQDYKFSSAVKMTVFELISMVVKKDNAIIQPDNNSGNDVSSFSNDGVSVTLNKENVSQFLENFNTRIVEIIKTNLVGETNQNGAPLLYRGYCKQDFLPKPEPPYAGDGDNNKPVIPVEPIIPPGTEEPDKPSEPDTDTGTPPSPEETPETGGGSNESDGETTTTHF